MKDELQLAKLNYDALNQQLLDDIPKFCSMSEGYLQKCLSALIHSVSGYYTKMELAFKKIAKPLVSTITPKCHFVPKINICLFSRVTYQKSRKFI